VWLILTSSVYSRPYLWFLVVWVPRDMKWHKCAHTHPWWGHMDAEKNRSFAFLPLTIDILNRFFHLFSFSPSAFFFTFRRKRTLNIKSGEYENREIENHCRFRRVWVVVVWNYYDTKRRQRAALSAAAKKQRRQHFHFGIAAQKSENQKLISRQRL